MKKVLSLLLVVVLCMSLFAACSNGDTTTDENNTTNEGTTNEGTTTPDEGTTEPSGDGETALAADQTYVTYIGAEPMTLDLQLRSDTYSSTILMNTLEGLTRLAANENNDGYEYLPAGASDWESNEDGTVWTFHLNDNYWSDGEPVTAQDYVYSVQRYVDPATASPMGYRLDCLLNYDAVNSGELPVEEIGVKAIDDKTLEVTLSAPTPYFLDLTHNLYFRPQRQDIVEQYGEQYGSEANTLVSCGPFTITSWTHNSEITLVKNEQYWDAENVTLDNITVKIIADTQTANNAFLNGELDYISTSAAEWIQQFQNMGGTTYVSYPSATLSYAFFNCQDEIFSNANIRKAFITGVDRVEINEMAFDGARIPTYGWVVPTIYCGDINFREYAGDPIQDMIDELEANGQTPKDLLLQGMEELGLGNDPSTLDITFSLAGTDSWFRNMGEYLQQAYGASLGVNLEISFSEWGIFISNVESGNYQIGFMGWGAGINDPYDVLSLHTSDSNAIYTGWSNEEYDALIAEAAVTMDDEARAALYKEAEDMLLKEYGVANPLATSVSNYFYRDYVTGYDTMPLSTLGYKYIQILEH